jgi:hypothetical protein
MRTMRLGPPVLVRLAAYEPPTDLSDCLADAKPVLDTYHVQNSHLKEVLCKRQDRSCDQD